jgi:hypothetical protein
MLRRVDYKTRKWRMADGEPATAEDDDEPLTPVDSPAYKGVNPPPAWLVVCREGQCGGAREASSGEEGATRCASSTRVGGYLMQSGSMTRSNRTCTVVSENIPHGGGAARGSALHRIRPQETWTSAWWIRAWCCWGAFRCMRKCRLSAIAGGVCAFAEGAVSDVT